MTTLDEIKIGGGGRGGSRDRVSELLKQEDEELVGEVQRTKLEDINIRRKRSIAENKRVIRQLETDDTDVAPAPATGGQVGEILASLVGQGMEPKKAIDLIKELDQEPLGKLMMLNGSPRGMQQLMPLWLSAKKENTTAKELAETVSSYIDTAMKIAGNGGRGNPVTEFYQGVKAMKEAEGGGGPDPAVQEMKDEIKEMREKREADLKEQHQRDLEHQREVATLRQESLTNQINQLSAKIDSIKVVNPVDAIKEYKAGLEAVGLKVSAPGAEGKAVDVNQVIDTVIKSPAVESFATAAGEAMKDMAKRPRAPYQSPPATAPAATAGQQVVCEICRAKGVITPLNVTAEVRAGIASITCPVCWSTYGKPKIA